MSNRHQGRVAAVTGGAVGIGQAFARRLAADGAAVAVVDLEPATETMAMLSGAGADAASFACDVTSEDDVARLAGEIGERFGRCDILVNNAGIYPNEPFEAVTFAKWRRVMAINLDSMFLTAKAFAPGMVERGWGRIVNMASNTFGTPVTGYSHYIASKGGAIGFTRALASDLADRGITVNAIAPSLVRTHGTQVTNPRSDERFAAVASMQAIKREQRPDDLAGTLSFLASDDAAFVTGQTLYVDGGWVRP
ncbi:MAG: SDR family NAD(P)-dependent oxidoreductase [Defluviicoccus sp.]|nr:SDR family NAD(P)-dependent oxidoreductase [Defluviicoccus sp.]